MFELSLVNLWVIPTLVVLVLIPLISYLDDGRWFYNWEITETWVWVAISILWPIGLIAVVGLTYLWLTDPLRGDRNGL